MLAAEWENVSGGATSYRVSDHFQVKMIFFQKGMVLEYSLSPILLVILVMDVRLRNEKGGSTEIREERDIEMCCE
jgi:hypothetical protein